MVKSLVSNPPYNMKWSLPPFAQDDPRFCDYELPPENNANYVFILTALESITDKAVMLLPCGVLTTADANELKIRQELVGRNIIEAVITCPDKMFVSTSIPTCLMVLNKKKQTSGIMMIDMKGACGVEERKQKGQFGAAAHTGRTYVKKMNFFRDEDMQKALDAIAGSKDVQGFSRRATVLEIREQGYNLTPARYIENVPEEIKRRPYADIIADINRVRGEKNLLKLTVNESLSKKLGLHEVCMLKEDAEGNENINRQAAITGISIIKEDYVALSKSKNEFRFENRGDTKISSILMMVLQMWKQHIYFLNEEENRYLAELRDALLPELMKPR